MKLPIITRKEYNARQDALTNLAMSNADRLGRSELFLRELQDKQKCLRDDCNTSINMFSVLSSQAYKDQERMTKLENDYTACAHLLEDLSMSLCDKSNRIATLENALQRLKIDYIKLAERIINLERRKPSKKARNK